MKRIKKRILPLLLGFSLTFGMMTIPTQDVNAQCPMCRMSVESNYKNGGSAGKGSNMGILYMLAMPYLLVGTIGYLWWRNRNKDFTENEE